MIFEYISGTKRVECKLIFSRKSGAESKISSASEKNVSYKVIRFKSFYTSDVIDSQMSIFNYFKLISLYDFNLLQYSRKNCGTKTFTSSFKKKIFNFSLVEFFFKTIYKISKVTKPIINQKDTTEDFSTDFC